MKPGRHNKVPPFVALPRQTLKSPEWRTGLSSSAKILYLHLKNKFVGYNNGEICLHYSEVSDFMAMATIRKSFKELEEKGWIEVSRKIGGDYRFTKTYTLTGRHDSWIKS